MERFERIEEFSEDMNIIQKLGDNPNSQDGLSGDGLKIKFDEGGNILKSFINAKLVPVLNSWAAKLEELISDSNNLFQGGSMAGPLNMNGNELTSLRNPTNPKDAVPKDYVDENLGAVVRDTTQYVNDSVVVSDAVPSRRNVLWFDTSMNMDSESFMLDLTGEPDSTVQMRSGGITYGVRNTTVNEEPTQTTYDFTVL